MDLELENEFEWPEKGDHEDSVRVIDEASNYPEDGMIPIEVFTLGDKQDWTPQTEEDFEWLLRKLHSYKAEERQFAAKLKSRVDEAKASYSFYMGKYGKLFDEWVKAQVETKAKKPLAEIKRGKSLRMELGTPGFKSAGGEIEIDTAHPDFGGWLRDNDIASYDIWSGWNGYSSGMISVSVKFNVDAIRETLEHSEVTIEDGLTGDVSRKDVVVHKDSGEVVEWATWIPERQEFYVKF